MNYYLRLVYPQFFILWSSSTDTWLMCSNYQISLKFLHYFQVDTISVSSSLQLNNYKIVNFKVVFFNQKYLQICSDRDFPLPQLIPDPPYLPFHV